MEENSINLVSSSSPSFEVPLEIWFLLAACGLVIFLWDFFDRRSSSLQKNSGLDEESEIIAVKGSDDIPSKEFFSKDLGLSGKPDALLKEDGFLIPVDVVPMSKKVQDRHIIKIIAHLKLIEHEQGKPSPYGILRMGKKGRIVKVQNTPEKRRWLESVLDEMRSIIEGVPAAPAPTNKKCARCDVEELCAHSALKNDA